MRDYTQLKTELVVHHEWVDDDCWDLVVKGNNVLEFHVSVALKQRAYNLLHDTANEGSKYLKVKNVHF